MLLAGRRITERDPLHPATRLGLSPSAWGRDPRIPGILRLVLLAGETGWLAEPSKTAEKEEMVGE